MNGLSSTLHVNESIADLDSASWAWQGLVVGLTAFKARQALGPWSAVVVVGCVHLLQASHQNKDLTPHTPVHIPPVHTPRRPRSHDTLCVQ